MSIKIWTSEISCAYIWNTPLKWIYVWTTKVRPTSVPRLPAEYQEVEYIESSWWQVIETDVTYMLHPFTLEVKYMKQNTDTSDQTLVWQRQIWKYVNIYKNTSLFSTPAYVDKQSLNII